MNNRKRMIEAGLVALFLCVCSFGSTVFGQELISSTDQSKLRPPLSGEPGNTDPIFAFEKSSFKLTASTTSSSNDGEAGVEFKKISWYYKTAAEGMGDLPDLHTDGVTTTITGTDGKDQFLTVSGLKPGFYVFMASAEAADGSCSTLNEEFTVFVLAPLTISMSSNLTLTSNTFSYCMDAVPEDAMTLTATASFDSQHSFNEKRPSEIVNPSLSDFELRYRWYKVANGVTFDLSQATAMTVVNSTDNTYDLGSSVDDKTVGEWNYYVVVDYTVKANTGPYQTVLGGASTATLIKVTSQPGKPVITIESVD